jgi:hypothetical protein
MDSNVNFKDLYPRPQIIAAHKENDFPYSETVQDKAYKRWYSKVKNKPTKITSEVTQIFRKRVLNSGAEKIIYDETLRGLDHNDNELDFAHRVGEWDKPIFRKQYDEETDALISQEIHRHEKVYEVDYSPEKVIQLASRGPPDTISLIVDNGSKAWGGPGIYSLEEFANARFEDLIEKGRTGKEIELEIPKAKKA